MGKAGAPGMRGYNVAEILAARTFFEFGKCRMQKPVRRDRHMVIVPATG